MFVYVIVITVEPLIIPRKGHCVSRKQISPNAVNALYRLYRRGFIAYLVGGCVRDLLLGRTPKDFDIATNATPRQISRLFRNCRLIGRRFRLAHLHFQDEIIEVATFRRTADLSDVRDAEETGDDIRRARHLKDKDGMVLRDNVFGTPEQDALCRDFTINALAYNIADFSIIDYTTGLSDLRERLIRPIGDPYVRFTEDPVRMVRAVRFSASRDFAIEPVTWEVIRQLSSTITRVPPARLYEEIQKLFLLGAARLSLILLEKSGLFAALFPRLSRWIHGESHALRLLETNMEYLDELYRKGTPPSPALFLAAFFGPSLEEEALARHRDGVPYQQALDAACSMFTEEVYKGVGVPGRVNNLLRAIFTLQPSLHRIPPRRPSAFINRPEFKDAMAYLSIMAETRKECRTSLEWWNVFLSKNLSIAPSEPPADEITPKPRRRRRRRRRRGAKPAV